MWNRTENQVILAMIRHGETRANEQRRYLGKTDEPLSNKGRRMLLAYKEEQRYPRADILFASPMKRCVETAGILYPMGKPVLIPEWEEINFGRFEYKNYEELKDDACYQEWLGSKGVICFPGGESREAFVRRCESGFRRMLSVLRMARRERESAPLSAGIIVHGGTIMALMSSYGDGEYFDYQAGNGRGYLCRMDCSAGKVRMKEIKEI